MRKLQFSGGPRVGFFGTNASLFYAKHWLGQIGLACAPVGEIVDPKIIIRAGNPNEDAGELADDQPVSEIILWDFQSGRDGDGLHAAAAAGVSWVLGHDDAPPLALPIDIPEKWCGLVGANLALSSLLEADLQGKTKARRVDISAADILRSFADQNAGNHTEVDAGWRRNGSMAVEHGGIYPQGFFACRDGHIGIVGRSRKDWAAIRDVIGRPPWCEEERFDDPFALAANSAEVDVLLTQALSQFDRDELLKRAIKFGATLAPVYAANEIEGRDVVRKDFFAENGETNLPFEIVSRAS